MKLALPFIQLPLLFDAPRLAAEVAAHLPRLRITIERARVRSWLSAAPG